MADRDELIRLTLQQLDARRVSRRRFIGRAGIGVSMVGGDQLSLLLHAGNVMGATPGDAVWGGSLEYSVGLWR